MRRRTSVRDACALRPHDHAVWFGDSAAKLYAMATAALTEGVRRHEKLMFVAPDADPARLADLDGLDRLLAQRQLEVLPLDAVYGAERSFSAAAQLAAFEGALTDALAEGYSGMRIVADNTTLARGGDESFRRWLAWEQMADHFQAASRVTGICFFDSSALSAERLADLVALHPVRCAEIADPPFCIFADGDVVVVTGALDALSAGRFRRLLGTVELDRRVAVDLTGAHLIDEAALLVLSELANPERPLRVRGAGHVQELLTLIGPAGKHLRFERAAAAVPRCTRCGDVIGVYEQVVVVTGGTPRLSSRVAEPDALSASEEHYHRGCYPEDI